MAICYGKKLMKANNMKTKVCWECKKENVAIHNHHPVPKSRGGTKTIPLCETCHSKAHHMKKNMTISRLTKAALSQLKSQGVKLGHPNILEVQKKGLAARKERADQFALDTGKTVNDICELFGITSKLGIANKLNELKITTRLGRAWSAKTVKDLMNRHKHLKSDQQHENQ